MRRIAVAALAIAAMLAAGSAEAQVGLPAGVGQLSFTPSAAPACSYALPLGSNTATAAFSFRRLSASYSGPAVRLIRASDSTTLDVGFSGCDFDTASAAPFCTATTCRVAIWYNQGPSGDVSQATIAKQPTYQASCQNSLPCGAYTLSSSMELAGTIGSTGPATYATVAGLVSLATTQGIVYVGDGTALNYTSALYSATAIACGAQRVNTAVAQRGTITCTVTTGHQMISTLNGTLSSVYVDGTKGTDSTTSQSVPGETAIQIGTIAGLNPIGGRIAEVLAFSPDLTITDSNTIAANQKAYWATP